MSNPVMITTPASNAMEGHGLTEAVLIVDGRRTAVAYSVFCPATERYSLVTLDGRWVIPGKEGYKTRGPATTYARKNLTDLRPEDMRVYEPLKHFGRPQVGRYGARRSGQCMGHVRSASVGYECGSCRAFLSLDHIWREGFTIVGDGRGTHTVSYALDRTHARSFGEGAQRRVTSPEAEAAIAALEIEREVIRKEADGIKALAAEAESYADTAEAGKTAALDSRNVAEAHAGAVDASDASRNVAFLETLAVSRCEGLDKLRDAFRQRVEAVTAEAYERDADRLFDDVAGIVATAWEHCGVVEESTRTARMAAEAADAEYGRRCLKCETFYREPARSGEAPTVPCACSALYAGSVADVTDPGTVPVPWECPGQLEFAEGESDGAADADTVPVAPVGDAAADVAEGAEDAPADPGYSLDVAPGERVWSRPGFDRSYEGRAEVLRGHVSVADARAAVARFPESVKIIGGAPGVGMGCAMMRAKVTRTGEDAYTWGGANGSELIRTSGNPYEVTFPDGTTVRGTWVECGAQFAEWAVTERPEWVCASAEGYADGYATMAQIRAKIEAEREADARAFTEAVADAESARADLNRVWSAWSPVVDDLSSQDADTVWDVDADGRRGLAEAERARAAGNRWGVEDGARRARAAVAWLTESARRSGLEIPEAAPVAAAAPVPDATEIAESGAPSDAASGTAPAAAEAPAAELGTCTAPEGGAQARADVVSDPGTVDAWEGEGGAMPSGAHGGPAPVGRPGPYGARLVTKAEAAARARAMGDALRPEAEARAFVARERAAWLTDMRDLLHETRSRYVAGVPVDTAREWYSHAHRAAKAAAAAADGAAAEISRFEWEAKQYEDDAEHSAQGVARARSALARMTAGDVPVGRGVWLSADGGAAISFPMPSDEEYAPGAEGDRLFVGMLADAVAARDEGRTLKSKDVPSLKKTGHGPGAEFKSAVVRATQPRTKPWTAPRIPAQGTPLVDDTLTGFAEAGDVVAETEAAPGVWLPMAAVRVADTATANGWTVAMERSANGSVVIVRAAGVIERHGSDGATVSVAGECVAVFEDGQYVQSRSGALVGMQHLAGATLHQVLTTVGQTAAPGQLAPATVTLDSAPAPAGVSDPGGEDTWETDGGACTATDQPGGPDAGRGAAPAGVDPSPEMGTCTAQGVDGTPVRPDVVSDPGTVDTWEGEGGATPGVEPPRTDLGEDDEPADDDPYTVRPAAPGWAPLPGTHHQVTELTCAGTQYRVYHAPDAVLPYTVRYSLGGADVDLGGWVGLDDVRAIVRADRRRSAALEADRLRVEQQERRAAYRLQERRQQEPLRLTEEDRRAIARRAEERHRPVAAELYVSPITRNAVLAFVCGTCATTHEDVLCKPQKLGGSYPTPMSVERHTMEALVEKQGWTITGPWRAHGTDGDTMRAPVAPTSVYLDWVEQAYGPDPATPEVEPGERIVPVQRGWWDVVSKEGRRYELTCRPTLTGPVWSVRHRSSGRYETVATTGHAATVLPGMRAHSAERANQPTDRQRPEAVHVSLAN
ncbi:hypothetical protein [Streptomyces sasae]|uniref:hypothetical protein n=1 Tax=Streptomyces sasae TaxID=1266772 RepID=UPI002930957D|nr:hypothetical protein [Streptomyces sasae]